MPSPAEIPPMSYAKDIAQTIATSWGDVQPVPWIHVEADYEAESYNLSLRVVVRPHVISSFFFEQHVPVEGGNVLATVPIDQSAAVRGVLRSGLLEAARTASYLLREFDPRIGTPFSEQVRFPRSLLFDPPRIRPPAYERAYLDAVECIFCSDRFRPGYPAMWGGGNLHWVHPSCWLEVHTKNMS